MDISPKQILQQQQLALFVISSYGITKAYNSTKKKKIT